MRVTKVYKLHYSEGYEWLLPASDADFDLLRFDGRTQVNSWRPVRMRRLRVSEQGQPLEPSDFPACSGGDMLMLGRAARDKFGGLLERFGELLPLSCDDGDFWTLNVTRLINALDESNSDLLRSSDTGSIIMIKQHTFRSSELGEAQVFKLQQMPRGLIYATGPFVDLVKASEPRGLEFVCVWTSN